MKKYISIFFTIILTGCETFNPEILTPVTNLTEFYKQCKNSELLTNNSRGTLSLSDRFYCLGYVQAASESAIYWRKQINDISPQCHLMVSDFYYELISYIEEGIFTDKTPIPEAFKTLSYKFCPKIQYISRKDLEL